MLTITLLFTFADDCRRMKSRDRVILITAGVVAAELLVWTAMRLGHSTPPATVSVAQTPAATVESVPRISSPEFQQRLDRSEIVVIDVRDAADYTAAHIPGAIHIPVSFMAGEIPYLPRGKPIVTYCT
jgi:hydroxyacylglutathione hydrolase